MKRLFFEIQYDGTEYHGWQRQKNALGIQQVIEDALAKLFQEKITIYGCGRTDAGVHASQYFFHVNLDNIPEVDIRYKLNRMLPEAIVIKSIYEAHPDMHARYSAVRRTYVYNIHKYPDPFRGRFSTYIGSADFDIDRVCTALEFILANKDFNNFCKTPDRHKSTECKIFSVALHANPNETEFVFEISANRFLKSMVRIIVDRLIKVGRREITLDDFGSYFSEDIKAEQVQLAPPQGLFLHSVTYPEVLADPIY